MGNIISLGVQQTNAGLKLLRKSKKSQRLLHVEFCLDPLQKQQHSRWEASGSCVY